MLQRTELLNAFPNRPEAAAKLGAAIDALGQGARKNNGILEPEEIQRALSLIESERAAEEREVGASLFARLFRPTVAPTPQPNLGGVSLLQLMGEVMGPRAASRARDPQAFTAEVRAQRIAQAIDQKALLKDLLKLCKDPVLRIREAGSPSYKQAAEWVAQELKKAGFEAYGDGDGAQRSFLQAFRWEERYQKDQISRSHNVVGILRGTGPEPRRAVLITAHLDNLSSAQKHEIGLNDYEGANDNTAAVVAALAAARGLSKLGGLDADLIVMIPSAEEDGLKGTEAFVRSLPEAELDRFVGVLNLEMIGRNATEELLLFGGASAEETRYNPFYARAMEVAEENGITLKPGLKNDDDERWASRSDHWIFRNAGVPALMLHGRASPGSYHTEDDTVEKLNLEKIQVTARQVFHLVRDLASDQKAEEKRGPRSEPLNHYEGKVWVGDGE